MSRLVKNIICIIAVVFVFGAIIGLLLKVNKLDTTKRIGVTAYAIGVLDDETGKPSTDKEDNYEIYMKNFVKVSGLKCVLKDDAKIKYHINYYDEDYEFIQVDTYIEDFNGYGIPTTAKYVKIEIEPLADENGKVSLLEKAKYAGQLTVTVNK